MVKQLTSHGWDPYVAWVPPTTLRNWNIGFIPTVPPHFLSKNKEGSELYIHFVWHAVLHSHLMEIILKLTFWNSMDASDNPKTVGQQSSGGPHHWRRYAESGPLQRQNQFIEYLYWAGKYQLWSLLVSSN